LEAAIGIEPMNKGLQSWRSSLRKIASVFMRAFSLIVSPFEFGCDRPKIAQVAIGGDLRVTQRKRLKPRKQKKTKHYHLVS
jgi:hypothetical protein